MTSFEKNSECSRELTPALYSEMKKAGYDIKGPFREATHQEDAIDKIDVFFKIEGQWVPIQVRAYSKANYQPGFPIRDTPLKNPNEMELLLAGKLDEVLFAFSAFDYAPSEFGKYKFTLIKIVKGEDLRSSAANIIGDRAFGEGNHVSFIADPPSTKILRDWK